VGADTIVPSKATDTGNDGKGDDADTLWQIEDYSGMKFTEVARTF
jgi:hypothetical protein